MALYKRVNGSLVKLNSDIGEAVKDVKEAVGRRGSVSAAIKVAVRVWSLTPAEAKVLREALSDEGIND